VVDQLTAGAGRRTWLRWAALAVAGWVALWALVPTAARLPAALRTRALVVQGSALGQYLGSGWYPLEADASAPGPGGRTGYFWHWSAGPRSSLRLPSSWSQVRLLLLPVTCPDGRPQAVEATRAGQAPQRVELAPGWRWYGIGLAGGTGPLYLSYRCIWVPARAVPGSTDRRTLAIQLAGVAPGASQSRR
jgi:hypothetical protein